MSNDLEKGQPSGAPVIITADRLAAALAVKTGVDLETCAKFVTAFCKEVETAVSASKKLTVNGMGTFTVVGEGINKHVAFTPDQVFADTVNAPFAAFAAIALFDDELVEAPSVQDEDHQLAEPETPAEIAEETVEEVVSGQNVSEEEKVNVEEEVAIDEETEELPAEESVDTTVSTANQPEPEPELEPEPETVSEPYVMQEPAECVPESPAVVYEQPKHSKCICMVKMTALFIAGLIVGIVVGYLCYNKINAFFLAPVGSPSNAIAATTTEPATSEEPKAVIDTATESVSSQPVDTVKPATAKAEEPSEADPAKATEKTANAKEEPKSKDNSERKPRYDQVTRTVYLATLARKYYGNGDYWVYIYEANKLKHPDKVAPGTWLRIPYPDELPFTGDSTRDIKTAKRKGQQIYARFK